MCRNEHEKAEKWITRSRKEKDIRDDNQLMLATKYICIPY